MVYVIFYLSRIHYHYMTFQALAFHTMYTNNEILGGHIFGGPWPFDCDHRDNIGACVPVMVSEVALISTCDLHLRGYNC